MSFIQTILSFFGQGKDDPSTSTPSWRSKTLSQTHDAFSLPTHSSASGLPVTSRSPSSPLHSYSYPPAPKSGGSANGFESPVPNSPRGAARPNSLLPVTHTTLPPLPPYPPLQNTWNRIRSWLAKEYPEIGDTLNYGILPPALSQIEMQLGFQLPAAVRESYMVVDGQEAESASGYSEGLFFGLTLLPLEDVLDEWRLWREVDEDTSTGANPRLIEVMRSLPPQWVRQEYSCRGWLPLATDRAGNYLGVDVDPGKGGVVGQVIVFGRDFDTKVVLWRGDGEYGWARWLASFAEELEIGEGFEIGDGADTGSEHSADSIGFEGYFYDGAAGSRGEGGAEGGTGGMRLTGEYKGWNILEAWADRSVKRWQEAGIIPDEASVPTLDVKQDGTLGALASGIMGGSAEVAIPVLAQVPEESSALAPADSGTSQPLPTIAVTVSAPPQSPIIHSPKPSPLTPTVILSPEVLSADENQASSASETSSSPLEEDSPTQETLTAPVSPPTLNTGNAIDPNPKDSSSTVRLVGKQGGQDPSTDVGARG